MSDPDLQAPTPTGTESESVAERLVRLECLNLQLQHDFETLNAVVLRQQRQLDRVQQLLTRFDDRLSRLGEMEESRDPAGERPPHY